MVDYRFILIAALLSVIGHIGYVVDTLRGRTRPNVVSWSLWAVPPIVTFTAQAVANVGHTMILTFVIGLSPVAVLLACCVRHQARWKITTLDYWCGALSLGAIALWVITDSPNTAIVLALFADACAAMPTVLKAYRYPRSESCGAYILFAASSLMTLLTIKHWSLGSAGYPAYTFALASLIVILIVSTRKPEADLTPAVALDPPAISRPPLFADGPRVGQWAAVELNVAELVDGRRGRRSRTPALAGIQPKHSGSVHLRRSPGADRRLDLQRDHHRLEHLVVVCHVCEMAKTRDSP